MAKTQPRGDMRATPAAAAQDPSPVRMGRRIRGSDTLDGFVVGLGAEGVLLAVLDPSIFLNGYAAVRIRDVARVTRRGVPDSFVARALRLWGVWPPVGLDGVNLDRADELQRTAAAQFPLITVHVEEDDPEVRYIGHLVGVTTDAVDLVEISPEAEWHDHPTRYDSRR